MFPIPRDPRDRFTWQRASDASWGQKSVPLLFLAVVMIAGSIALAATVGPAAAVGFFFGAPFLLGFGAESVRRRRRRMYWRAPDGFDPEVAVWKYAQAVQLIQRRLQHDERILGIAQASTTSS